MSNFYLQFYHFTYILIKKIKKSCFLLIGLVNNNNNKEKKTLCRIIYCIHIDRGRWYRGVDIAVGHPVHVGTYRSGAGRTRCVLTLTFDYCSETQIILFDVCRTLVSLTNITFALDKCLPYVLETLDVRVHFLCVCVSVDQSRSVTKPMPRFADTFSPSTRVAIRDRFSFSFSVSFSLSSSSFSLQL